jgi:hypothetical protein
MEHDRHWPIGNTWAQARRLARRLNHEAGQAGLQTI